jgi:serine/threonine protein phosphatase PrpC
VTFSAPHPNRSPSPQPPVVARVFALTDVGHTREHNEDTYLVADLEAGEPVDFDSAPRELPVPAHGLLFLVADGMGGAASGELASSMAGDAVIDVLRATWRGTAGTSQEEFAEALREAADTANARIHRFARENPEHRGMGTTATIAGLLGDRLLLAQVGDSRAYLVRGGTAQQLTKDQSLMQRLVEAGEMTQEEADASERRNIILQALGPEAQVTIDLTHQQIRRGDTLIICSDGLSGLVRPHELAGIASEESDPRLICQRLVDRANSLGGPDNITVIVARFDGDSLASSQDDDSVGYTTFPLRRTLGAETAEERVPHAPFRSDPTTNFGTLSASSQALEDEFARARDAEDGAMPPDELFQIRRKKIAPIQILLLAIAAAVTIWFVMRLMRAR